MLATPKVKMSGSEKQSEQEHIKCVTRNFLEVSRCSVVVVQNNGKEMYKKILLHVQSCFFAN